MVIVPVPEKNLYRLDEDYCFSFRKKKEIWIPKGFEFDGASIPQIFWSIIGGAFHPDFLEPALRHDWAYITRCIGFLDANWLFLSDLQGIGVPWWKRNLMWSAVASAGWLYYRKKDYDDIEAIKELIKDREDREKFLVYAKTLRGAA
jgi:hypothetical protein